MIPRYVAAAFVLALGASSCKVVGAKVANLEALHEENGRHTRTAALFGSVEYTVRHGFFGQIPGRKKLKDKEPRPIKDPAGECLENVLGLSTFDPNNLRVAEPQVELLAFVTLRCPWKLSRRAAVEALGKGGQRLKLEQHPAPPASGEAADPAQVAEALGGLIQAMDRRALGAPAMAQACAAVAALELDFDGLRRCLRTAGILLRRSGATDPAAQPLRDLSLDLQRRCTRAAIEGAVRDPSPLVRAEAIAADVRCGGMSRLAEHFARLNPRHPQVESKAEVVARVLALIEKRGLPALGPEDDPLSKERGLALLYALSTRHPAGRVRNAGMRSLRRISGGEVKSLREEDWQAWWSARQAAAATEEKTP